MEIYIFNTKFIANQTFQPFYNNILIFILNLISIFML